VTRARLEDLLRRGTRARLTLVSAPAGFGKTSLLADWLAAEERTVAWVSLDDADNDPTRFWTYVLTALGEAGASALELLPSSPVDAVLSTLANDLAATGEVLVVLDDLHAVHAPEVHEGLTFLLDHLPPTAHLVVATRADPPLPLARLRARGELVEVRAADLRFTADEAAAYLEEAMGLTLTADDVEALEARTEGWIAALQLAALSLQGRDDPAGFIADFAGDDRFVVDYLAGEVLARQPDDVRRFLLETSVLNRLTGPLCDAVTGVGGGRARLEELDRANLFLVPLDDRRQWYRYHHLFADVLRAHLLDEEPGLVPELHRRATEWFEAHDDRAEAIRHAMAGGDVERAAGLVELAVPALGQARQDATIRAHLDALPDEVYERRPVLLVARVGSRMVRGEVTGVEELLDRAEALLDDPAAIVVDQVQLARLPSQIAMYRTAVAHLAGDLERVVTNAHRLLEVVAPDDPLSRGAAQALLALANWGLGQLVEAERREREAVATFEASGYVSDALGCSLALADVQRALGRAEDAQRTLEHGLALAGGDVVRGMADLHVALSELCLERDDVAGARAHLADAKELGDAAALPQNPYRSRMAEALLLAADGDLAGADELLAEAEPIYNTDFSPPVRPVAAVRARIWLEQGDVDRTLRWAAGQGLSADDELEYVREYEHVTLARALLAAGRDEAEPFLERLLQAAEEGGRTSTVVEVRGLLSGSAEPVRIAQPLVDPLSERELDVLRLLRTDLSGPEIAKELYVSLNTLRTHTKRIYTKLGVTSRRAAVTRATELGL